VAKANGLLDLVPGNSLLTKTGVVATGVGLTAVAVSKELLLLHPETIVLGAFAGMVVLLHQQLTPVVANELDTRADEIRKQLNVAGDARKASLLSEIETTKGTTEVVAVTKELFTITKEVATLQAQIRERELRRAIGAQFRAKLDYIAQLEAQKRALEQQKIIDNLRARITEAIQDPKFQTELLKKCVTDLESLSK
jgi:F-type H+-transporting ATPase subunit b